MADAEKEKPKISKDTSGRPLNKNKDDPNYDPFQQREIELPTNDFETFIHLLLGCLGTGILAVPYAYLNIGLWLGIFAIIFVGFVVAYCIHILVKCSHILCFRRKIPQMAFCDVAEQAFLDHSKFKRFAFIARQVINISLFVDLYGCCVVYLVFAARNIKQIADVYLENKFTVQIWIAILTVPMIFMCSIRSLKNLVPFSSVANAFMLISIIIVFSFILTDLPNPNERPAIAPIENWPMYFGTIIFALECIGLAMSLENSMKNPTHFIGCPSVLCFGYCTVVFLYMVLGFFGYLKYGELTQAAITLNLPIEGLLSQSAKGMISTAVYMTFTLQFYVPLNIAWRGMKDKIPEEKQLMVEYILRIVMVILSGVIGIILPNIGPFLSLLGALCLSTLGLIMPSFIELAVYHDYPGYGYLKWRLWKNILLICFGLLGLATGTFKSVLEFKNEFKDNKYESHV